MERTQCATITFVGHSGFMIEICNKLLVFDYFIDESNVVKSIDLSRYSAVYVLVSHSHHDHFNPEIFKLFPNATFVIANEVKRHCRRIHFPEGTIFMKSNSAICNNGISINAFSSTDVGVSFCVTISGKKIFHAGDLNNWHWADESTPQEVRKAEGDYMSILRDIKTVTDTFQIAMFPVDARIGSDYFRGAKQFAENFHVVHFFPMHFTGFTEEAFCFDKYANKQEGIYHNLSLAGESITINI
ncbi:MAG: MBL fold metallo-hydrolase [Muribaculaceae bacterium]